MENENLDRPKTDSSSISTAAALVFAGMVCATIVAVTWIIVGAFA